MSLHALRQFFAFSIFLTTSCSTNALGPQAPAEPVPLLDKVMIIVLENTNYKNAYSMPFLGKLCKLGSCFSKYRGVTHPSQPNYIAMISGSQHRVVTNQNYDIDARSIVDLLEENGKTWKAYMEAYPGNCFKGSTAATYKRKHNPFISFKNIQNNPERCAQIVNAGELDSDIEKNSLANFSFYTPDMNNDGHDTGVEFADKWLEKTFGPKLSNPQFMKNMTLIVTFDESETYLGNHIYTAFVGEKVKVGGWSTKAYNHYNLLRTLEEAFGLGTLGKKDAKAAPISDIWKK